MERASLQLLMVLVLLFTSAVASAEEWQVVRTEQGIVVSIRKVEGSPIAETRAVMKLKGVSLSTVLALISDVSNQHVWIDSLDESHVLAEINPTERIIYTLSKAPWPVADRDAVVRSKFTFDREKGVVRVESHAEPDYIPENKNVVRIRKVDSSWTITRLSPEEIEVRYQVHSEPGGKLPAWIINNIIYNQPYMTLLNMREQVKLATYRDAHFDEIEDGAGKSTR